MKKSLFLFALIGFFSVLNVHAQETIKTISGKISDGNDVLKSVEVTIKDSDKKVFTKEDGSYSLEAKVGDVLQYSYTGLKTLEILVEDVTRIINLTMYPDIKELDEVVVTESRRKSQEDLAIEYDTNPNLIRSAFGIIDPATSAFQVRVLPENRISNVRLCIIDLLRGQFAGVQISGDCFNGGSVNIRGRSSLTNNQPAIFDVDGQVFFDAPIWLDVANMKRVAVMSGLASRNLYGAIASGGVVVINTAVGNVYAKSKELKDKARLRDNFLTAPVPSQDQLLADMPVYYQRLHQSSSLSEAKEVFQSYADTYRNSYVYFLDAYNLFAERWEDLDFANSIIEEHYALFDENPLALKSLAYSYEAQEEYAKANAMYKEVFLLRPSYAQSYQDLANSYRRTGDYKKAAALYMRYRYLIEEGFLVEAGEAFDLFIDREVNNLVTLHGKNVLPDSKPKKYMLEDDFDGTRLVFEWSDSEAEFELQFVNPEKQYMKWNHSLETVAELIRDEKLKGYSSTEYLIDNSLKGTWQVNAKYLGNKSLTPVYLKATIYYNYGELSQRHETKVFKLSLRNVNQQLFTISNSARLAVK